MSNNEIEKILDELHDINVNDLTGRARNLFYAIMKIADERDELLEKNIKLKDKFMAVNKGLQKTISKRKKWKTRYQKTKRKLKQSDEVIDDLAKFVKNYDFAHNNTLNFYNGVLNHLQRYKGDNK